MTGLCGLGSFGAAGTDTVEIRMVGLWDTGSVCDGSVGTGPTGMSMEGRRGASSRGMNSWC